MRLTSGRNSADSVRFSFASGTPLDSTARPIGEVMPVVLARYEAGPYRFRSVLTEPAYDDRTADKRASGRQALATGGTMAAG